MQNAIDAHLKERKEDSIADKDYLTKEAHDIGKEVSKDKSYGAALNAVKLKGELNQVFKEDTEANKYTNTMKNIFLQINQEVNINKEKEEAIDVTPQAVDEE